MFGRMAARNKRVAIFIYAAFELEYGPLNNFIVVKSFKNNHRGIFITVWKYPKFIPCFDIERTISMNH